MKKISFINFFLILLILSSQQMLVAQTTNALPPDDGGGGGGGTTPELHIYVDPISSIVLPGSTYRYYVTEGTVDTWDVSGHTSRVISGNQVTVTWGSGPTGRVIATGYNGGIADGEKIVSIAQPPKRPPSPLQDEDCDSQQKHYVEQIGTPESTKIKWYWQKGSQVKSMANGYAVKREAAVGDTYYLQAYHIDTKLWSEKSYSGALVERYYPIITLSGGTACNGGNASLVVMSQSEWDTFGAQCEWFDANTNTSLNITGRNITVPPGRYYGVVRTRFPFICTGLKTPTVPVFAPIDPVVDAGAIEGGGNYCSLDDYMSNGRYIRSVRPASLTSGTGSFQGYKWYFSKNGGPDELINVTTADLTVPGHIDPYDARTIFKRQASYSGGCSGTSVTRYTVPVTFNVYDPPSITNIEVEVEDVCGQSTIYLPEAQGDYTFYWQKVPGGQEITDSRQEIIVLPEDSRKQFYLSARHNKSLCWSTSGPTKLIVADPKIIPDASITASSNQVCIGASVTLLGSVENVSEVAVSWEDSSGKTIFSGKEFVTPPLYKDETFLMKVVSWQGCESQSSIFIEVLSVPNLYNPEKPIVEKLSTTDYQLTLNNLSTQYDYYWLDQGAGVEAANRTVNQSGIYVLNAINPSGCIVGSASVEIFDLQPHSEKTISNPNYIKTLTYLEKNPTDPTNPSSISVSTEYLDGLGRPVQVVDKQASPEKNDIVLPLEYNEYGNSPRGYLPYSSGESSGNFKSHPYLDQHQFYNSTTSENIADSYYPFTFSEFERAPLGKVNSQHAPGESWTGLSGTKDEHGIKSIRESNKSSEVVLWEIQDDLPICLNNGEITFYKNNTLSKSVTRDESYYKTIEFIDLEGKVVLKSIQISEGGNPFEWAETYYIYDDFGNLRFVLPPEASKNIDDYLNGSAAEKETFLSLWAFQYKYDERKRMIEKRVPGADWVYMVYDARDRLVLTQDGNQRNPKAGTAKKWSFTKYDALNRPILTGTYENAAIRSDMQIAVDQFYEAAENNEDDWFEERIAAAHSYTNQSFPKENIAEYLSVTYYDNYSFKTELSDFGLDFDYKPDQLEDKVVNGVNNLFPDTENLGVKGQVTGSKVKVLREDEDKWIKTVNYYDEKYRPIQSITENHFGKKDIVSSLYDFPGKVLTTLMVHNSNTETSLKTYKEFTYDHAGRLLETYQQIGDDPADKVLIAQNEYNELGELVKKNLHKQSDATYAQSVDYRYNIRGWLNRINNSNLTADDGDTNADFFGTELFYNYGFDKPQFNGNISGARWKNVVDEQERAYGYTYDAMNRLTGADYIAGETGNWTLEPDRFEVGNLTYDMNGNILSLHRNGLFRHTPGETAEYGITDQLGYKYKGNQLMAVNDAIDTPEETKNDFKDKGSKGTLDNPEYKYDPNGNMIRDGNKGITIDYNYLNLPKRVDFGNGKYMEYTYDAAGTKLYQIVVDGGNPEKRTDYIAGMVYENDKLQFMQHEEGRVIPPGLVPGTQPTTEYEYQYHLKDHLGNVRLTFTTTPEIDTDGASVEPAHIEDEKAAFLNYDEVTKINYSLFDHTGETESQYSVRLSGTEREKIGLAKSMTVMTGDTIRAEVFGKYLDPDQTNWSQLLQEFITAVAENTVAPGTVIEASIAREGEAFPFGGLLNKTTADQQGPQAYLNYLVFDKDFVLVEDQSGYVPLTQAAKENGTDVAHEELNTEIIVGQPGYVYIYLSNDNAEPMEVYFDDFHITHAHSAIVQADDYYPFGLSFNSYQRPEFKENMFKLTGKERIDDLDLNWDDFGARMYIPEIGRWGVIDPMAEKYIALSPYNYTFNNPVNILDIDGECPTCPEDADEGATHTYNGIGYTLGKGGTWTNGLGMTHDETWEVMADLGETIHEANDGEKKASSFSLTVNIIDAGKSKLQGNASTSGEVKLYSNSGVSGKFGALTLVGFAQKVGISLKDGELHSFSTSEFDILGINYRMNIDPISGDRSDQLGIAIKFSKGKIGITYRMKVENSHVPPHEQGSAGLMGAGLMSRRVAASEVYKASRSIYQVQRTEIKRSNPSSQFIYKMLKSMPQITGPYQYQQDATRVEIRRRL